MYAPGEGVYVYDMGRNMTGWARLRVRGGTASNTISLRYGEAIHDSGAIDCHTAGGDLQKDHYTMKGGDEEFYEPRFTYHGFQYVELTGYPGTPDLDTLTGCFAHTAVEQTGSFECANDLINRIHSCTVQSQRCNIQMGVVTDDTQRAERLGWCGDIWAMADESYYNFWMPRVWEKWVKDCCDQQDELGMIGYITPLAGPAEDLVWSAAFVIVPWLQYQHCGDRRILEESYPSLERYVDYLEKTGTKKLEPLSSDALDRRLRWRCDNEERFPSKDDHGFLQISKFGDHLATNEGGSGFSKNQPISIATAFYYHDVDLMRRIAEILGKDDDAERYRELAAKIKDAFNERFFNSEFGYYDIGAQSAQAWALSFGLVPEEHIGHVASYLCSSVNFRQRRLTTGYAGTKWAVHAISAAGRDDILWKRAIATDYPSWGYMLRDPKRTTITENWMGSASLCHTVLGAAVDEWFYWGLAGIRRDESGPGFERIIIKPYLPADLEWARASLKTVRGTVVSGWRKNGDSARLSITVPANCSATVHIPAQESGEITEGAVPAGDATGVAHLRSSDGETIFEVGSGEYVFEFPAPGC
jgi:alpha-L-rhamnosidase